MTSPVRLVHAARCRLDVPATGLTDMAGLSSQARVTLEDASLDAFDRLVEQTRKFDADALLLVGDTIRAADRSLRARRRLEQGLERLEDADVTTVIVPGSLDPASCYESMTLPRSTVVLTPRRPSTLIETTRGKLRVGFVDDLSDGGRRDNDETVVGIVPPAQTGKTAATGPRRFEPASDLEAIDGLAYAALGNGRRTSVEMRSAVANDPGPLSPASVRDTGVCGATAVEFAEDGRCRTRSLPCSPVVCEEVEVSIVGVRTLESLAERMSDRLPDRHRDTELTIVRWHLKGVGPVLSELSAVRWQDVVELVDDEAGRSRIHLYETAAESEDADEIASMLVDEFEDRLSAGDLDPRDEFADVESQSLVEVLEAASVSPLMPERTSRIGAAVFAESCQSLWDAA